MKHGLLLTFIIFISTITYPQNSGRILSTMFDSSGKVRNNWYYIENFNKCGKLKSYKGSGFSIDIIDGEPTINVRNVRSLSLTSKYMFDIQTHQSFKVSFDIMLMDSIKDQSLYFENINDQHRFVVFSLTEALLDTMEFNVWHNLSFQFFPKPDFNKFIFSINYFNAQMVDCDFYLRSLEFDICNNLDEEKNLIPNGSFEEYYEFPLGFKASLPGYVRYWNNTETHYTENPNVKILSQQSSASYFSIFASDYDKMYAKIRIYEGHFASEITNEYVHDTIKETRNEILNFSYIQACLKEPLKKGCQYEFTCALMLSPYSNVADNSLGIKFSTEIFNPMIQNGSFINNPRLPSPDLVFFSEPLLNDSSWTTFKLIYTATGGEKYISVGAFENLPHKRTAVPNKNGAKKYAGSYLVDSIKLIELGSVSD